MKTRKPHATRREARLRCAIVRERIAWGWTHQEIAERLGVDRSTVTYYASSKRCKHGQ